MLKYILPVALGLVDAATVKLTAYATKAKCEAGTDGAESIDITTLDTFTALFKTGNVAGNLIGDDASKATFIEGKTAYATAKQTSCNIMCSQGVGIAICMDDGPNFATADWFTAAGDTMAFASVGQGCGELIQLTTAVDASAVSGLAANSGGAATPWAKISCPQPSSAPSQAKTMAASAAALTLALTF